MKIDLDSMFDDLRLVDDVDLYWSQINAGIVKGLVSAVGKHCPEVTLSALPSPVDR